MPLSFDESIRTQLIKNCVFIIQVTYIELTIQTEAYNYINAQLFQEADKGVELTVRFENNELLFGEKASVITKIDHIDDSEIKLNLRSELFLTQAMTYPRYTWQPQSKSKSGDLH